MKAIKHQLKRLRNKLRLIKIELLSKGLCVQLSSALEKTENIPVIVISYNNGRYVKNTCKQLNKFSIKPIIIDNHSTEPETLHILKNLGTNGQAYITYSKHNFGHGVGFIEPVYLLLPNIFAYTDPDLMFNENLPSNFLETLTELTTTYSVYKAGFALDLRKGRKLKNNTFHSKLYKPFTFERTYTIYELESRFWTKRLHHDHLEVYAAPIDTTFAVYRKDNFHGAFDDAVRVAGDFSAIHIPWFEDMDFFTEREKKSYLKNNKSSNWIK